MDRDRALKVLRILEREYKKPRAALRFRDPLQLLVATILSAQCTDARVNKVTEHLFSKYKTAEDYANADLREFEEEIRPTGFYKNKARNIISAARIIVLEFGGRVPHNMNDLLRLPGVARKTANIVLSNAYGKIVGIAVDTHVSRLSQRLGFTKNHDPVKIERDLMELFPREKWYEINYLLIEHGRRVCSARNPKCEACVLSSLCPSSFLSHHKHK